MTDFEDLWREALPCLKTVACSRVVCPEERADLIQETCIKAYVNYAQYNPQKSFRNWILRIFQNCISDLMRRRGRRIQADSLEAMMELHPDLEVAVDRNAPKRIYDRITACLAIESMTEAELQLASWYADGLTMREMSELAGVHQNTLATRHHRTAKRLSA